MKQLKTWFFNNLIPTNSRGKNVDFRDGSEPSETIFRSLLDSSVQKKVDNSNYQDQAKRVDIENRTADKFLTAENYPEFIDSPTVSVTESGSSNDHIIYSFEINSLKNSIFYISDAYGDDDTAEKGNVLKPYKTIKAAILDGDIDDYFHVFPGVYNEDSFPIKNGMIVYLDAGVSIIASSNGGKAALFSDLVLGQPIYFALLGKGTLVSNGSSYDDTNAIVSGIPGSKFYVEAGYISSLEAWNGGYISVKNAYIDFEAEAYAQGELYFDRCKFINFGSVNLCYSFSGVSKITYEHCHFEKNNANSNYISNFQFVGRPTQNPDVLDVFAIHPFNIGGAISTLRYIFNDCTFVQKRIGGECVTIQSGKYSVDSSFQFTNCRFYNVNNDKNCLLYTSDARNGLPSTVGSDSENVYWFFNNNLANVGWYNSNVSKVMTNQFLPNVVSNVSSVYKLDYNIV